MRKSQGIPYVSLYQPQSRGGRWDLSYTLGKRHVEHLGLEKSKAERRARVVSQVIDGFKCKNLTLDEALRKVGSHRPLPYYIAQFEKTLKGSETHKRYVMGALKNFVRVADITTPDQLTIAAAERVATWMEAEGRAPRTIGYWLQKARQFGKWLKKVGVLASNPLDDMGRIAGGVRRPRRPATPEDVAKLCKAAMEVGFFKNGRVSGETRRLLYLTAFATGLRYGELKRLQCHDAIIRDTDASQIKLPAASSKNKQGAVLPIPTWLAEELAEYLFHGTGEAMFPDAPRWITKAMSADLAQAGIERQNESGFLDFHGLRHGFVTQLARSGVDVKTLQTLARHSTAVLTLNVYTHVGELEERAKAVELGVPHPERGGT